MNVSLLYFARKASWKQLKTNRPMKQLSRQPYFNEMRNHCLGGGIFNWGGGICTWMHLWVWGLCWSTFRRQCSSKCWWLLVTPPAFQTVERERAKWQQWESCNFQQTKACDLKTTKTPPFTFWFSIIKDNHHHDTIPLKNNDNPSCHLVNVIMSSKCHPHYPHYKSWKRSSLSETLAIMPSCVHCPNVQIV